MNDLGLVILVVAIVTALGLATVLCCHHLDRRNAARHEQRLRDLAAENRAHRAKFGRWA